MQGVGLSEIQQWTKAEVVGTLEKDLQPAGISTDSRSVRPGELFLALKGENFDGHLFVESAFAGGACAAVVERAWGV